MIAGYISPMTPKPERRTHTIRLFLIAAIMSFAVGVNPSPSHSSAPTFYEDVLPILQQHCQTCHRVGEIAPMPLVTYAEVRKYAAEMKEMTGNRMMPPWFADPRFGHFANDPSLTRAQIGKIAAWADAGAQPG